MSDRRHRTRRATTETAKRTDARHVSEEAAGQAAGDLRPARGAEEPSPKDRGELADPCAHCTLAEVHKGDRLVVTDVDDPQARLTALRFGMAEGACIECLTRIPAGPIVLRSGRQEIAVGRELAKRIHVRHQADTHSHRARRHGRTSDDKGHASAGS